MITTFERLAKSIFALNPDLIHDERGNSASFEKHDFKFALFQKRLDEICATAAEEKISRASIARAPEFQVHICAGNIPNPTLAISHITDYRIYTNATRRDI